MCLKLLKLINQPFIIKKLFIKIRKNLSQGEITNGELCEFPNFTKNTKEV